MPRAVRLCCFALTLLFAAVGAARAQPWPVEFSPALNWAEGAVNPVFTVSAAGVVSPGAGTVSRFLQGSWQPALGNRVTFSLTTTKPLRVGLRVAGISAAGGNTIVIRSGATVLGTRSFDGAGAFDVPLAAGTHAVVFENTGLDWVNVAAYTFAEPAPVVPATLETFAWLAPSVGVYAKAEGVFTLSKTFGNPYDPDEVAVDALVTGPAGITYVVPAFWSQTVGWDKRPLGQFANFTAPVAGSGRWRVRLTPEAAGTWSVVIRVTEPGGTPTLSAPQTFAATPSDARGFVRLDPLDRQGYRYDNGEAFIPIGFNLCWNDGSLGTFYDSYLGRMTDNGANWIRYWMTPFARQSIEWSDSHWFAPYLGLGRYSQEAAALLDHVVETAEASGVHMQLVLEHHGLYSTTVDADWATNPYNTANGGPLASPAAFFTDAGAIAQAKKKYRYVVARWGYSPAILAWELFNEVNFTNGTTASIASWHQTMAAYLKQIDPYTHLVTTSSSEAQLDAMAGSPAIDVLQQHTYDAPVAQKLTALDDRMLTHFTKPVLVGEFGSNVSYDGAGHPDAWGDHVRQAAWIGSMKRVPNMFWFWDTYLLRYDLFSLYRPLAFFWGGEDPGAQPSLASVTPAVTGGPLESVALTLTPTKVGAGVANPVVTVAADGTPGTAMNQISPTLATGATAITFNLTTRRAGVARVSIASTGAGTAAKTLRVVVDGAEAGRFNVVAGSAYEVALAAGARTVTFETLTPQIAVTVGGFTFTGFDARPTLVTHGLVGPTVAYVYAYDTSYGAWAATGPTITDASLVIDGLAAGDWRATFVHPVSGDVADGPVVTVAAGRATVPLPPFSKDLALKLRPVGARETYARWRTRLFTPREIASGVAKPSASAESNASGATSNLLKFALGSQQPKQPLAPAAQPQLIAGTAGADGAPRFRFPSAAGGVTYVVERSADLLTWTEWRRITAPAATSTELTFDAEMATSPRVFLRLRAELP